MTEDQLIVLSASILFAVNDGLAEDEESAVRQARRMIAINHRLNTESLKKATLHKPSVEEWNDGYQARQFEKNRGR